MQEAAMDDVNFRGYSAEELELQFNPRATVPDHEAVVTAGVERSAAYRAEAKNASFDVAYGAHPMETMDIFRPAAPAGAPVHVYIHGGFWRSRVKEDFSYVAGPLVEAGAIVCVVNYALCPDVTLDEIVRQMRACCAFLWRNPDAHGGDPDRIHVSGHSAGGHLTAMLMATDWPGYEAGLPKDLVKSAVLISGIYEIAPVMNTSVQDAVQLTPEIAERNSPVLMKPATNAPMAIAVGGVESDEFRRQSKALADLWTAHAPVEFFELDGLNHFTVLSETANADNRLTAVRLKLMGLG
jgi:arylformamidase